MDFVKPPLMREVGGSRATDVYMHSVTIIMISSSNSSRISSRISNSCSKSSIIVTIILIIIIIV